MKFTMRSITLLVNVSKDNVLCLSGFEGDIKAFSDLNRSNSFDAA